MPMLPRKRPTGANGSAAPALQVKRDRTINANLDERGHPVRVGSVVCMDGPKYGRVLAVMYDCCIVRDFAHELPLDAVECTAYQTYNLTVCEDPPADAAPEVHPVGAAVFRLQVQLETLKDQLLLAESATLDEDKKILAGVRDLLGQAVDELWNVARGNLAPDQVPSDLADALDAE